MTETYPIVYPAPTVLEHDTARAAVVAQFRELADRIERGELRGARIQWREGMHHTETVELTETQVELRRHELYTPERPDQYDAPNLGEPTPADILEQVNLDGA
jgi:hypothetical protein